MPISELVFGTLTQNRSSLEPSLGFAASAGTPHCGSCTIRTRRARQTPQVVVVSMRKVGPRVGRFFENDLGIAVDHVDRLAEDFTPAG